MDRNSLVELYRPLFGVICRGFDDDDVAQSWEQFVDAAADREPDRLHQTFVDHLLFEMRHNFRDSVTVLSLENRDPDTELVAQVNLLLSRLGLPATFEWRFYDPGGFPKEVGFHALNEFLRPPKTTQSCTSGPPTNSILQQSSTSMSSQSCGALDNSYRMNAFTRSRIAGRSTPNRNDHQSGPIRYIGLLGEKKATQASTTDGRTISRTLPSQRWEAKKK